MTTAHERLDAIRAQLVDAANALTSAEEAFDVDAATTHAARISVLERFEVELLPLAAAEREAAAIDAGRQRMRGLRSAAGSLITTLASDEERVRSAATALATAITTLNARFHAIEDLHREHDALTDRFPALADEPALRGVDEPDRTLAALIDALPSFARFATRRPSIEEHPDFPSLRRRDYREIAQTKAAEIVAMVGAKPWHITPAMRAALDRDRANAARVGAAMASETAHIPREGPTSLAGTI